MKMGRSCRHTVLFLAFVGVKITHAFVTPSTMRPASNGREKYITARVSQRGGHVSRWDTTLYSSSLNEAEVLKDSEMGRPDMEEEKKKSPLSLGFEELVRELGGKGRALAAWDCYRIGIDPLLYFNPAVHDDALDSTVWDVLEQVDDDSSEDHAQPAIDTDSRVTSSNIDALSKREKVMHHLPKNRQTQGLGNASLKLLQQNIMQNPVATLENSVGTLVHISQSSDGTTKLLVQMVEDGLQVETVIIPWQDRGRSTLCVSSQVGCRQGCTFCATGRMGRLRSLTTDEILIQLYYANKVCRVLDIYAVDNIVFMGMGEPADNAVSVTETVQVMADRQLFGLAASKITISTVAPTPESFLELGKAPALLAWSVHSTRDTLRRQLVPTTKNSMVELRDGLVEALLRRPKRMRTTMLEVVLIDHVNDDVDLDAAHLAEFVTQMRTDAEGSKILVNLIPFNDIGHGLYKKPSHDRVLAFQNALLAAGVKCYIRTTRGDDESAACGQLATKKMKLPQVVALESK